MNDPASPPAMPGFPEMVATRAGDPEGDRPDTAAFLPASRWMTEGLRAAFFQVPRVAGHTPTPPQVLVLAMVVFAIDMALLRLEIAGPARFDVQAWLSGWWTAGLFIALAYWAFPGRSQAAPAAAGMPARPRGVAACFVLWLCASLPNILLYQGLMAAIAQGWLRGAVFSEPWLYWGFYLVFSAWSLGVACADPAFCRLDLAQRHIHAGHAGRHGADGLAI